MKMHSSGTITVRPAVGTDMPALGRLGALLVEVHHAFDPDRFLAATANTVDLYEAHLAGQQGKSGVVLLVAEEEGVVIGYSYAAMEGADPMVLRGPAGVIHDLIVDPAHRGKGAARRLLKATRVALSADEAPRLVLSTAARNAPAQRLFASMGFRPTMIEMTDDLAGRQSTPVST